MQSYSRPLGDAVKRARAELGFTQNQVAEAADIDAVSYTHLDVYKRQLLAQFMDWGLLGVWVAMFIDWIVRALVFLIRFLRGRWKAKRVI